MTLKDTLLKPNKKKRLKIWILYLTKAVLSCNDILMSQIRDSILRRMLKLGLSIYQVSKIVEDAIPQRTVYAFLTGEKDTGTETASVIMKAIGLTIEPRKDDVVFIKGIKMREEKPKKFKPRVKAEWEKAGKPKWSLRELLGICLLVDLDFKREGSNPAATFRKHIELNNYTKMSTWANGLKIAEWK